jgi:uncharacterized protein YkwD
MAPQRDSARRTATWAATVAALVATLIATAAFAARSDEVRSASGAGPSACRGVQKPAAEASRQELRRAVRCLLNEERTERGLGTLARDPALQKAAQRHSKVMGETNCLAHRCPGEPKLETRVRKAGYLDHAERWRYAESTGCGASASAMVSSWMASGYHRVNILERSFRELGAGVVRDRVKGRCARGYATFAVVLGWREPNR